MGLPALDQELDRLKAQLADLRSHYTERHPDVRKVKEQIDQDEKIKQQIIADLNAEDSVAQPPNLLPLTTKERLRMQRPWPRCRVS